MANVAECLNTGGAFRFRSRAELRAIFPGLAALLLLALPHAATARGTATDSAAQHGTGGPYEPVDGKESAAGDAQFKALFLSWKKLDTVDQGAIAVPSQRPVQNIDFTSGFGVRSDPFRGSAAMHTGIDLAGQMGTPIYATADGTIDRAEWTGGYGNMVEIDHGKGIQTRYGHLSQILVHDGQRVKRGDLIAKMGSTGRSTGTHLHYEVRIDGHAVNPLPFLQSTDYLLAVQSRALHPVAVGGPDN